MPLNFRKILADAKQFIRPDISAAPVQRNLDNTKSLIQALAKYSGPFIESQRTSGQKPTLAEISAYNPLVGQTDARPRETATQTQVKEGRTIATNDATLLGKKVKVGDNTYIIEDLMNKRFRDLASEGKLMFDIFMEDKKKALQFGRKSMKIELLD